MNSQMISAYGLPRTARSGGRLALDTTLPLAVPLGRLAGFETTGAEEVAVPDQFFQYFGAILKPMESRRLGLAELLLELWHDRSFASTAHRGDCTVSGSASLPYVGELSGQPAAAALLLPERGAHLERLQASDVLQWSGETELPPPAMLLGAMHGEAHVEQPRPTSAPFYIPPYPK